MLVRSRNLTVLGQQSAKTLGGVASQMEQFRAVVGALIPNAQRPLPVPSVVFVFGTHKELERFLPLRDGKAISAGGYFQHHEDSNHIALQLEGFDESARIVFHEYAHLLLHNAARSIPLWMDEGLAEFYSTYTLERDGKHANIGRPIVPHVALLRERLVPISELIAVTPASPWYNERDRQSIFYAEVWALTHYLMTAAPDGPAGINRYATGIAQGGQPDEVFQRSFGRTPADLEKELRNYVHSYAFNSRIFTFNEKVQVDLPDEGRALPAGEAAAWTGDLLRRVGRLDEAAARIDGAVAAAGDTAMPQLATAWLRLAQKKPDEAWPAFERAAALAPDDFSTQFAYGVALLRREADAGRFSGQTPAVDRARSALAKAVAANPSSSDAHAWLAYAEMLTKGMLTMASASIRRAMELAPGRLDYLLRYADIFILADARSDARTILTDLSRVTTDSNIAHAAKQRLEALDEREALVRAAALADAERRKAQEAASDTAASAGSPSKVATIELERAPERATRAAGNFKLRPVQRGEERAYGDLTALECSPAQVRFVLKVGSRAIVATAKRMEDVTLTEFVGIKDFAVACGTRQPPDAVYLTWRAAPLRSESGATVVGQAIAVEFVPRGFTP
jgi:tetratricopeptide (TPR) repeat protein